MKKVVDSNIDFVGLLPIRTSSVAYNKFRMVSFEKKYLTELDLA